MSPENEPRSDIEKLEQRFAENPQGRVFAHLADAYRKAGQLEQAESLITEGLKNHPNYLNAYIVLGRVYLDADRFAEARDQFARVLDLDPHNLIALKALGDLAVQDGKIDEGRSWYERMLQIDPYNEEAQSALSAVDADQDGAAGSPAPAEGQDEPAAPEAEVTPEEEQVWEMISGAMEDTRAQAAAGGGNTEPEAEDEVAEPMPWETGAAEEPASGPQGSPPSETPPAGGGAGADDRPRPQDPGIDFNLEEMDNWTPGLVHSEGGAADREESVADPVGGGGDPHAEVDEDSGMVTETMAELYANQGLYDDALKVYRQLAEVRPHDERLRARIEELEGMVQSEVGGAEAQPTAGPAAAADTTEEFPDFLAEAHDDGPGWDGAVEFEARAPEGSDLEEADPFAASFDTWVAAERREPAAAREEPAPDLEEQAAVPPAPADAEPIVGEEPGEELAAIEDLGFELEPTAPDVQGFEEEPDRAVAPEQAGAGDLEEQVPEWEPGLGEIELEETSGEREWASMEALEASTEETYEPATAAESGPGPEAATETVGAYLSRLLEFQPGDSAPGGPGESPQPESGSGPGSTADSMAPPAGQAESGQEPTGAHPQDEGSSDEAPEDLAQFQAWLRSLKR